jgi:hypothetical protein
MASKALIVRIIVAADELLQSLKTWRQVTDSLDRHHATGNADLPRRRKLENEQAKFGRSAVIAANELSESATALWPNYTAKIIKPLDSLNKRFGSNIQPAIRAANILKSRAESRRSAKDSLVLTTVLTKGPNPDTLESTIVNALGHETLTGEKIAKRCDAPFNSNFKSTLSSLRKRGILENLAPGYRVTNFYLTNVRTDKSS